MTPRGRPSFATVFILAFAAAAVQAAGPPDSGQLLQEVPPRVVPAPSSTTGLSIERAAPGPLPTSVPFLVEHIEITGNTLLPEAELRSLVAPEEGKTLTLADLEALAARITAYYQEHRYLLSRAYVPAQTLSAGTVRIAVLEARYGAVMLINTSEVSDAALNAILAPLKPGRPVAEDALERTLLLLSDVPGAVVNSTLSAGAALGSSDLHVSASPGAPYSGSVGLDDAGNSSTGRGRLSATVNVNNPLHLGDLLSVSAMTTASRLTYARLGYQGLVDGNGSTLSGSLSALDYHLGNGASDLRAHGTAQVQSLTLMQPWIRSTAGNLFAQIGFDHRQLRDEIDASETHSDRHTNAVTITLAGDRRDDGGISNMSLAISSGSLGFDDAAAANADASSAMTHGSYGKATLSLARLQGLSGADSLYLAFNGQLASKNLDSSEQLFVGGPNSVRGYDVGVVGGARGGLVSAEWRHTLGLALPGAWQAIAFADGGAVQVYKDAFTAGPNSAKLGGAGLGLNWVGPNGWTASAAMATPVGATPALVGQTRSTRFWAEIRKAFTAAPTPR